MLLFLFLCPKAKRAWPLRPHLVSAEEAVTTILPCWQLKEGPKRSSRHGNDKKLDHLRPWQKLRWRLREIRGTGREHFGPMPNLALQRTLLWWKNSALRKNSALLENSAVVGGAHKCYKWMAGGSEGLGRPPLENCNKSTRRESRCERSRVTTWRATHIFKQTKTRRGR